MNNNNNMILKHNGGDDNKKLISSLSCASNKHWIDNMYKKANENDIINGNSKDSTSSKNNNDIEHDYKMERNLAILICLTLVLSICLGKLRNLSHMILLNQFNKYGNNKNKIKQDILSIFKSQILLIIDKLDSR